MCGDVTIYFSIASTYLIRNYKNLLPACYIQFISRWYCGMGRDCEAFNRRLAQLVSDFNKTNFFNKTNLIFIVEQSIYRVYYVNILETC